VVEVLVGCAGGGRSPHRRNYAWFDVM